jgi:hypothetical protein
VGLITLQIDLDLPVPLGFQPTSPTMSPIVDSSAIPGTATLVDVQHVLNTRHGDGANEDIVLIPTPSADPEDPLNWSPKRKLLSTVCVSV